MGYDRADNFPFDFEPNGIPFYLFIHIYVYRIVDSFPFDYNQMTFNLVQKT